GRVRVAAVPHATPGVRCGVGRTLPIGYALDLCHCARHNSTWAIGAVGSALPSHGRGRRFESGIAHTMAAKRVVISGASGLIGRALTASLRTDDADVIHLVRRPARSPHEVEWLTENDSLSPDVLAGADAVVNLNGASISRLPWTSSYRTVLRESRLHPTRTLATALTALGNDAPAFLSASAVGYYGDRAGASVDESSTPGNT